MSSYPSKVDKFIPWTKAMIAGAIVGKPSYPGTSKTTRRRRKIRRRKKQNAKKD